MNGMLGEVTNKLQSKDIAMNLNGIKINTLVPTPFRK
jgi:hypothetical protein